MKKASTVAGALACLLTHGSAPAMAADIWLSPNLQSADYRALLDFNWNSPPFVDVFKFHMANLGNDSSAVGPNTANEILARNGFARLLAFGMKISLESGVIKPPPDTNQDWCTGNVFKTEVLKYRDLINNNGGVLSSIAMDEPLSETVRGCHLSYQQALDGTVNFMSHVSSHAPDVELIDIEPFPGISVCQMQQWVDDLLARGMPLKALHVDVNREIIFYPDREWELISLAQHVRAKGLKFGVIFFGQRTGSNEDYVADVLNFYAQSSALRAVTDHFIFQSWHPSANGLDIPLNVWNPSANHLGLIKSAETFSSHVQGQWPCTQPVTEVEYLGYHWDVNLASRDGIRNGHPFLHYKRFGPAEGRCPISGPCTLPVSAAEYLELYDDVRRNTGFTAQSHYANHGQYEGRCPVQ